MPPSAVEAQSGTTRTAAPCVLPRADCVSSCSCAVCPGARLLPSNSAASSQPCCHACGVFQQRLELQGHGHDGEGEGGIHSHNSSSVISVAPFCHPPWPPHSLCSRSLTSNSPSRSSDRRTGRTRRAQCRPQSGASTGSATARARTPGARPTTARRSRRGRTARRRWVSSPGSTALWLAGRWGCGGSVPAMRTGLHVHACP